MWEVIVLFLRKAVFMFASVRHNWCKGSPVVFVRRVLSVNKPVMADEP